VQLVTIGAAVDISKRVKTSVLPGMRDFRPLSDDVIVVPAHYAAQLEPHQLLRARVIVTSHHPHDRYVEEAMARHDVDLVLSVGTYSYRSNSWITVPHAFHRDPIAVRAPSEFCPVHLSSAGEHDGAPVSGRALEFSSPAQGVSSNRRPLATSIASVTAYAT
jgi:hypothetical protein